MQTYDDAAYDRFRSGLINAGFSPSDDDGVPVWTGPLRASVRPLTNATRMQIRIHPGWPLRYAHVVVAGLRTEHDAHGTICLWAEDDPAQVGGRELSALFDRLDRWADAAQNGFRDADRALDASHLFAAQSSYRAELPLADLIASGADGYTATVFATVQGSTLLIKRGNPPDPRAVAAPLLHGAVYLRADIGEPPRTLDDIGGSLLRNQRRNLAAGLSRRAATVFPKPSGGHDFIVLTWPRYGEDHDALVVSLSGAGDDVHSASLAATANDVSALRGRAGPDADLLAGKTVVIAGAGSVGGHVAVALACSGVSTVHLHDSDYLTSGNLVRHVSSARFVGYRKTDAVAADVEQHAPWTTVIPHDDLPYDPLELRAAIAAVDLVVDCTGILPLTAALAEVSRRAGIPLLTGALYHHGALARVQRQIADDVPLGARPTDDRYHDLPPDDSGTTGAGFLELGCTAPVNNAPPVAVLGTAADLAAAAIDLLTGRRERPDERIIVFRPMGPPFEHPGILDPLPVHQ